MLIANCLLPIVRCLLLSVRSTVRYCMVHLYGAIWYVQYVQIVRYVQYVQYVQCVLYSMHRSYGMYGVYSMYRDMYVRMFVCTIVHICK